MSEGKGLFKLHIMAKKETSKKNTKSRFINMPVLNPHAAGIDIGDTLHAVAVPEGRDDVSVRSFGAMTCDLHEIVAWLKKCEIDTVAMESTGVEAPVCPARSQRLRGVPGQCPARSQRHRPENRPERRPVVAAITQLRTTKKLLPARCGTGILTRIGSAPKGSDL